MNVGWNNGKDIIIGGRVLIMPSEVKLKRELIYNENSQSIMYIHKKK